MPSEKKPRKDTDMVVSEEDELLTVSEVATKLRVDDTTVRRWIKLKALPAVVLPHVNERLAYRVRRTDLDKVLRSGIEEA